MIAKTSGVLVVALVLAVGACSNGDSTTISTSSPQSSTRDIVPDNSPTTSTSTTSTPATTPTVPHVATTVASGNEVETTRVVASSTTSSPAAADTSAPIQATESSAPVPSSDTTRLADFDCTSARSDATYDLVHVTVESLSSRYRLSATYTGDTFQHDILISFVLGSSSYLVTAELFEDGTGVGRISGAGSSEDVFLDRPQKITPGSVDLNVRSDQLATISGTPFNVRVSLKVDGSEIESCQ